MAKTYKVTDGATITITNVATVEVLPSYTGDRVETTLGGVKEAGIADFEFVLDADGNFVVADGADYPAVGGDNVKVVVRQSVTSADRFVQFYRTQQKIKLASGDAIEIPVKTAAEVAYYLQYADVDGLTAVASSGVVTKA